MVGKQGTHMKEVAEKNKRIILELLAKRDYRHNELIEASGLSRGTVSTWLKKLRKGKKVVKVIDENSDREVYHIITKELLRDIIVPEFVRFIGEQVVVQILQKEMRMKNEIDMREAFSFGTIELFVENNYKNKDISYEEILDILKEEYGDWIVKKNQESWP